MQIYIWTIILLLSLKPANGFLRFGARNCMSDCFTNVKVTSLKDQSIAFYCQNGREMGWCCKDQSRAECTENKQMEMYCSINQDYNIKLRRFFCIRQSSICGTSQTLFFSSPIPQTISVQLPSSLLGISSTYGQNCWYEIRQGYQLNSPEYLQSTKQNSQQLAVRITIYSSQNLNVYIAQGKPNNLGNRKSIQAFKEFEQDIQYQTIVDFQTDSTQSMWILFGPRDETSFWSISLTYQTIHQSQMNSQGNVNNLSINQILSAQINTDYKNNNSSNNSQDQNNVSPFIQMSLNQYFYKQNFWQFVQYFVSIFVIIAFFVLVIVLFCDCQKQSEFEKRRREQLKAQRNINKQQFQIQLQQSLRKSSIRERISSHIIKRISNKNEKYLQSKSSGDENQD